MEPLKGALQGFRCVKNEEMWACWSLKPTTGRQWGCLKLDANGEREKTHYSILFVVLERRLEVKVPLYIQMVGLPCGCRVEDCNR